MTLFQSSKTAYCLYQIKKSGFGFKVSRQILLKLRKQIISSNFDNIHFKVNMLHHFKIRINIVIIDFIMILIMVILPKTLELSKLHNCWLKIVILDNSLVREVNKPVQYSSVCGQILFNVYFK